MPLPIGRVAGSLVMSRPISDAAPFPLMMMSPMWETSNIPTRLRTFMCSSAMPVYCSGISHPPKSIIRAPDETCQSYKGVLFMPRSSYSPVE